MNKPLDILVVTGAFPLASETFVREQCRSLVELGQNVEVLALRPAKANGMRHQRLWAWPDAPAPRISV